MAIKRLLKGLFLKMSGLPATRWLIALVASLYGRRIIPGFRVFPEDGLWVHCYPGQRYGVHEKIQIPKRIPEENNDPDLLVGNLIHQDPAELRDLVEDVCQYIPKPGDAVVDVGAGKGTVTAVLAHFVGPNGKVMAIEAHPGQFHCTEKNCQLNQLDNVTLVQKAVSDSPTELVIQDGDNPDANAVSGSGEGLRVAATTLDELLSDHNFETVDLLTMNIEGAEAQAIYGMTDSIDRIRHVAIACHDFRAEEGDNNAMRTSEVVMKFLKEHGFEIIKQGSDEYGAAFGDWIAARNKSISKDVA